MNFKIDIVRNGGRCSLSCMFFHDGYCNLFHCALNVDIDEYLTCDPCDQIVTVNCMSQKEVKS